nr:RNA-directed DNA polymerase, eukaryota [Tanacetum cinerariifolium]
MLPSLECKTRWINYVPIKVNVHAWKVMTDSLPTRFNIPRRGISIDSILCANCDTGVEMSRHLFFSCRMAQEVMKLIARWWNVPESDFDSYEEWLAWFANVRLPLKNKNMLEGVFYVLRWLLWWFRNKTIFEDKTPKKAIIPRIIRAREVEMRKETSKIRKFMMFSNGSDGSRPRPAEEQLG